MGFIKFIKEEMQVIRERDPAMHSNMEVFLYPSFKAIIYYRIAHKLYEGKHYFWARWVSQKGARKTGIEIHPGARIGKGLFIDHGNGVIIGETAIIGDNVTLYQGVTLGALSPRAGHASLPGKRHPTVCDYVTIYSGASILGGKTSIGAHSVVGGNAFLTGSVADNTRVVITAPETVFKNA